MRSIFVLSTTLFILISCKKDNYFDNPELMGNITYSIVKEINSITREEYTLNFITPEDLTEIYEGVPIDTVKSYLLEYSSEMKVDSIINLTIELNQRKRDDYLYDDLGELKKDAGRKGIEWGSVELLDFTFEEKSMHRIYGSSLYNNLDGIDGTLYLKYETTPFHIDISAVKIDDKYALCRLVGLYF